MGAYRTMGLATFAVMGCLVAAPVVVSADVVNVPSIESESASNITPTNATLEAQINPGGLETTYEVWVGASAST